MSALAARLRGLPRRERWLVAEAIVALAFAALAIGFFRFRRVASLARHAEGNTASEADQAREIAAVRWAISGCARRVPWRAKCLEQAFAAQWMLRRRAVQSVIYYGVAKAPEGLVAHAWVRTRSADVIGCENAGDFAEIARFPSANRE